MAILKDDLSDALVNAGATKDWVNKAATYEARLAGVETRLSVLPWMVGANFVMTMAVMFRVFRDFIGNLRDTLGVNLWEVLS
jgi:hypothetical protein